MSSPAPGHGSAPAADTDRIEVAQLLTDAAASGVLGLSEYEDRLNKVYAATTNDELDRLSDDLPGAVTRGRCGPCRPAPSTLLLAILSGFERRGRWNVPSRMTTFALWGGGVVDLRYADFTSHDVEIRSYSIMGGQTILVPPEVNVVTASASWAPSTTTSAAKAPRARRVSRSVASRCGAASA